MNKQKEEPLAFTPLTFRLYPTEAQEKLFVETAGVLSIHL